VRGLIESPDKARLNLAWWVVGCVVLAFTLRSDHSWPVAIGHLPFLCVVSIQVQVSAAWSVACRVHVRPDLAHVELVLGLLSGKQTVGASCQWSPGVYADGKCVGLYKAICVIRCQWTAPGSGRGLTKLLEVAQHIRRCEKAEES
jgi:hypothetical protein